MGKIIIGTAILLACSGLCKAEKPTSYDRLDNLRGNISFNVLVGDDQLVPMKITLEAIARTSDGGKRALSVYRNVGSTTAVILEGKDLYDALPSWAKPLLKEIYQEAIESDVSQ